MIKIKVSPCLARATSRLRRVVKGHGALSFLVVWPFFQSQPLARSQEATLSHAVHMFHPVLVLRQERSSHGKELVGGKHPEI